MELYRHFDATDKLLYVGITKNPSRRLSEHAANSHWWNQIAKITIERFQSKAHAQVAEKKAIRAEKPEFNKALQKKKRAPKMVSHDRERPDFSRIVLSLLDDMTESELAVVVGVNQSTVHRIKHGRIADPGYLVGARLIDLHDKKREKVK